MFEYKMSRFKNNNGQEPRRLQKALTDMGYPLGAIDGLYGMKTERAVRSYQADHGHPTTGTADAHTLCGLGIEVLPGIDVSGWQKDIDWRAVKSSGVRYVAVKATEGTTNKPSRRLFEHVEGLINAGIAEWALYHFSRIDTHIDKSKRRINKDAREEAESFLRVREMVVERFGTPTLPMWNDAEKGVNDARTRYEDDYNADWMADYTDVLAHHGVASMVYTARWAWNAFFRRARRENVARMLALPLVLADYDGFPDDEIAPWSEWTIWQYDGHGTCPGVKGHCDLSWMAGGAIDRLKAEVDNVG